MSLALVSAVEREKGPVILKRDFEQDKESVPAITEAKNWLQTVFCLARRVALQDWQQEFDLSFPLWFHSSYEQLRLATKIDVRWWYEDSVFQKFCDSKLTDQAKAIVFRYLIFRGFVSTPERLSFLLWKTIESGTDCSNWILSAILDLPSCYNVNVHLLQEHKGMIPVLWAWGFNYPYKFRLLLRKMEDVNSHRRGNTNIFEFIVEGLISTDRGNSVFQRSISMFWVCVDELILRPGIHEQRGAAKSAAIPKVQQAMKEWCENVSLDVDKYSYLPEENGIDEYKFYASFSGSSALDYYSIPKSEKRHERVRHVRRTLCKKLDDAVKQVQDFRNQMEHEILLAVTNLLPRCLHSLVLNYVLYPVLE